MSVQPIIWLKAFEIGIPAIDDEHKNIIEMINLIGEAINEGDYLGCSNLFEGLLKEVSSHFRSEEAILKRYEYPDIDRHILYHDHLFARADDIRKLCRGAEDQELLQRCYGDFIQFVIDDIIKGDLGFNSYLEEIGVIPNPGS